MKKLILMMAIAALLVAACSSEATDTTAAPTTTAATTTAPTTAAPSTTVAAGPTLEIADNALGAILTDQDGNILYLFLNDDQGSSVCSGDCESNWPALTGAVTAGEGVDASMLGTVARSDGVAQVTYNDWPLYHFAGDSAAGQTNGQGLGEVWYVVDAKGEPVK